VIGFKSYSTFLYVWIFYIVLPTVFLLRWDALPWGHSVCRRSSLSWIWLAYGVTASFSAWWSRRSILFTTNFFYGVTYIVQSRFSVSPSALMHTSHLDRMFLDAWQNFLQIMGISCGSFSCSAWELFTCPLSISVSHK
jgi:hypothetical protein